MGFTAAHVSPGAHCESKVHGMQRSVVPRIVVEQVFVAGLQLVPVGPLPQSVASVATVHCRHVPLTQYGLPATSAQSVFPMHGAHPFVVSSQRAAVALVHDPGVHVHAGAAPLTSHSGCVGFVQAAVCPERQVTQRFMVGSTSFTWQTGVVPEQPLFSAAVQGTHVFVAVLQTGVASCVHWVSFRQPQSPPDKQTRPSVHPQLVSGGVNASAPLSGTLGSNASRPGASAFASGCGPASIADASGQIGLG